MPYSIDELKNKPSYKNILDADKNELKKFFEDEELKAQQSGSTIEAVKTLRDPDGFILSYEDPENLGKTMPSSIQKVRLPMEYINAVEDEIFVKLNEERTFSSFRPLLTNPEPLAPNDEPQTEEEVIENIRAAARKIREKKQAQKDAAEIAKSTSTDPATVKENASNTKPPGKPPSKATPVAGGAKMA